MLGRAAAMEVGQFLPAFASSSDSGSAWESAQHIGKKVVVFYFYPGDFTGGCIEQAQKFQELVEKFRKAGAEGRKEEKETLRAFATKKSDFERAGRSPGSLL